GNHWYGKVGARERWSKLGHTVVYGEYAEYDDMMGVLPIIVNNILPAHDASTKIKLEGIGVVQEIDAAAMSVWLKYRHYEGTASFGALGTLPIDDFDLVSMGALINF